MNHSYKPEDHSSVSPYLIVDGAGRTIDFLVRTFGATELMRMANDDGTIRHAEVRLDDTVPGRRARPRLRRRRRCDLPAGPGGRGDGGSGTG